MSTGMFSTGQIGQIVGVTRDAVSHIVRTRGIKPRARVGLTNVYGSDAVERVRQEVVAMRARGGSRPAEVTAVGGARAEK